jgi:multiple sugar transport system substrate-binding protein
MGKACTNALETLRILEFLEHLRAPWANLFPYGDPELVWRIVNHLIRSNLKSEVVTISALAQAGYAPYTTAQRKVEELIASGLIERVPRGKTGKSFALQPSATLSESFETYMRQVKGLLAQTFGNRQKTEEADNYYFGGMPSGEVMGPPLRLLQQPSRRPDLRFLMGEDNYFIALQNMWADLRTSFGGRRDFDLAGLPQLYRLATANATRPVSEYDVIAVNFPWVGEFASRGLIRLISSELAIAGIKPDDFHNRFWPSGQWRGQQFGVPIYCTIETLAIRRDLFHDAGLTQPRTFDQVITAGRALHAPAHGRYGIVWNAARGMPIASSFLFLLGCCGAFIVSRGDDGPDARPRLPVEASLRVLNYMHRLTEISPPGVAELDWESSLDIFLNGHAAMTYCWSMRATRFEYDTRSRVRRQVDYLPHPAGPEGASTAPVGGFVLAVPANLPESRVQRAVDAIAWMHSPDMVRSHVKSGFPVLPRFSLASDPEMQQSSSIVRFVERVAQRNLLDSWQRPPIPEYPTIERILGEEIHDALTGRKTDVAALSAAQAAIDALYKASHPARSSRGRKKDDAEAPAAVARNDQTAFRVGA